MTSLELQSIENIRPYTAFYKSMYHPDEIRYHENIEKIIPGSNEYSRSFNTVKPTKTEVQEVVSDDEPDVIKTRSHRKTVRIVDNEGKNIDSSKQLSQSTEVQTNHRTRPSLKAKKQRASNKSRSNNNDDTINKSLTDLSIFDKDLASQKVSTRRTKKQARDSTLDAQSRTTTINQKSSIKREEKPVTEYQRRIEEKYKKLLERDQQAKVQREKDTYLNK